MANLSFGSEAHSKPFYIYLLGKRLARSVYQSHFFSADTSALRPRLEREILTTFVPSLSHVATAITRESFTSASKGEHEESFSSRYLGFSSHDRLSFPSKHVTAEQRFQKQDKSCMFALFLFVQSDNKMTTVVICDEQDRPRLITYPFLAFLATSLLSLLLSQVKVSGSPLSDAA